MTAHVPSNIRRKPANTAFPDKHDRGGLSLGATVGIGVGIALIVILGAVGAWIFVRRRRRTWAQKRKEQGDLEGHGETPNEEVTKKIAQEGKGDALAKELRVDGAAELGDGDEKTGTWSERPLSELHTDEKAYEISTAPNAVEIGEGKTFVAELEGSDVQPPQRTYQQSDDGTAPKPLTIGKKLETPV